MSRPGSYRSRITVAVTVLALGILFCLAPVASAQVPGVIDAVGDAVGGGGSTSGGSSSGGSGGGVIGDVVDGVTGGSSGSGGGVIEDVVDDVTSGGGGGGTEGGLVDGVRDVVRDTVGQIDESTGGSLGGATNSVKDAVGDGTENTPLNNPLGGFDRDEGKIKRHAGDGTHKSGSGTRSAAALRDSSEGSIFKTASLAALEGKARTEPAPAADPGFFTSDETEVRTPLLAQLAQAAGEAAEKLAFPLALTLMVVAFLMLQGRIDRKDAKLALAPIDSEQELLSFQ